MVVAEPEDGVVAEDSASSETTAELINPGIIKGHPLGASLVGEARGLDILPEGAVVHVAVRGNRVDRPAALLSEEESAESRAQDGARGLAANVALAAPEHDERTHGQHDGGESVRQVEADILLSVDHGDLADEGTDVDAEIEPQEDALCGDGRVDDDALARLERLDVHVLVAHLLDNQTVDIWLETTRTETDDEDGDYHAAEGAVGVGDDGRNGGDD